MNRIRNYFKMAKEYDFFTPRPASIHFWVFRARSSATESFIVIEEETQREAVDQLPTHDRFYTRDQLREMKFTMKIGEQIVRQSWTSLNGKRMFLDFYLSDHFCSIEAARDHIYKMKSISGYH